MTVKGKKKNKSPLFKWIRAIVIAIIVALLFKGFIIEFYKFRDGNFGKTIRTGDYLLINKLTFGARCPVTLLSLPFFKNVYSDLIVLPYFRLPAIGSLKTDDLLIFNNPEENDPPLDKKTPMIKRLIARAGDTLFIDNKTAKVNSKDVDGDKNHLLFRYRIVTDGSEISDQQQEKYHLTNGNKIADMGMFDYSINPNISDSLLNEKNISHVRVIKDFPGENTTEIFPKSPFFKWNKDYFGPVVIPFEGQKVNIDINNIAMYQKIIDVYEENDLYIDMDKIYINGKLSDEYTIKRNYFFVLDDSRDIGKDSRHWGFLPEDHIIGRVSVLW